MATLTNLRTKRRPVQARSQKMKMAIMESTHAVMREQGVRAVTTNAVAAHSGIKVGSIYDYFPNKEAIIAEIYEEKLARVRSFLEAGSVTITADSWQTQLATLIRVTWAYQLSIGLDRTIVDAAYYYESLFPIAQQHARLIASNYVKLLLRLGSTWPQEQLFDLGISLYTLVNANWSYWRLTGTDHDIAIERQIVLTITLISPSLDGVACAQA
ncbi:TetR/AcrR family transcriptional regulator [Rhizobium sp.]|uniref:TetR/AcrR family transcriptional regulator n=1 Tax=Rhizobium sp. TaxID=391 RepID=UPI000E7D65DD|nr:TetR/AcrR family transcriptional regulator [Rhizobium sp.]